MGFLVHDRAQVTRLPPPLRVTIASPRSLYVGCQKFVLGKQQHCDEGRMESDDRNWEQSSTAICRRIITLPSRFHANWANPINPLQSEYLPCV